MVAGRLVVAVGNELVVASALVGLEDLGMVLLASQKARKGPLDLGFELALVVACD